MMPDLPAAGGAAGDGAALAGIPSVDALLAGAPELVAAHGRADAKAALARAAEDARAAIRAGRLDGPRPALGAWVVARAAEALAAARRPGPVRVVNAAGVVVHTNLGRAPLSPGAVAAVVAAAGYCDLEVDLPSGRRGSRGAHVDRLLADAAGAEAAMAVNSCAAALVLALSALAAGRQVPVSRGHLVEIGGSFRLPDVMAASGARLLEVGTTNRTRARDYEAGDDVGLLLTVHPSNFVVRGFTAQPPLADVAAVARRRGVPLLHDAGSGLLRDRADGPLAAEGSLAGALAAGADLVVASGDKLLGGPQAGLVVGRADLVARLRTAPLARALRLDKLRLAALNATLREHLAGRPSTVDAALGEQPALAGRTAALARALGGQVVDAVTLVGGGSAPEVGVASPAVALPGEDRLADRLRAHDPPVVGRAAGGALVLDLRTVAPEDDEVVARAVAWARLPGDGAGSG
jgi:L-seryl-tRNA(Ser) seleniumtransferase